MISEEIIEGCKNKLRSAQNALYQTYASKVMGICIRYTSDKAEAEDVFQESFIKIYQNIKSIKNPEALSKWIKTLTVNTAVNHYHRNKKRNGHLKIEYNAIENNDFEYILSALSCKELLTLVDTLPPGYKVIFNLVVIDGYSHREIAEMLDINEGTSKSQLFKAKNILRKKLNYLNTVENERA